MIGTTVVDRGRLTLEQGRADLEGLGVALNPPLEIELQYKTRLSRNCAWRSNFYRPHVQPKRVAQNRSKGKFHAFL